MWMAPRAGPGRNRTSPKGPNRSGLRLGLAGATPGAIHERILQGLAVGELIRFQAASALPYSQLLDVVRLPASTFSRRKKTGRLTADESGRLYRVAAAFRRAVDLFGGNVAAARGWFTRPCRGLGWVTPLEMTRTDVGAREVEDLIGRLRHGVFT
jgi:putative toxin-antitoxin system antitoxin component (TIGR02293 family)